MHDGMSHMFVYPLLSRQPSVRQECREANVSSVPWTSALALLGYADRHTVCTSLYSIRRSMLSQPYDVEAQTEWSRYCALLCIHDSSLCMCCQRWGERRPSAAFIVRAGCKGRHVDRSLKRRSDHRIASTGLPSSVPFALCSLSMRGRKAVQKIKDVQRRAEWRVCEQSVESTVALTHAACSSKATAGLTHTEKGRARAQKG